MTEIRPNHQKLRFGFPPKVLGPSHLQGDDTVIPLIHGDKVMVEEVDSDVKGECEHDGVVLFCHTSFLMIKFFFVVLYFTLLFFVLCL